jgi:diguanylate cyclase (GGDEF)-like protein
MTNNQAGSDDKSFLKIKIFADQVKLLYKNLLLGLVASFICSAIIFAGLTYHAHNPSLTLWFLAVIIVSLGRLFTYYLYKTRPGNDKYYLYIFLAGVTLSAALWGVLDSVFMPANDVLQQMIVIVIIAGVTAGGAQTLNANLKASLLYVSIIIAPLCAWLFMQNAMSYTLLGLAMTTYLIFMLVTSSRNFNTLLEVMTLHYTNKKLVESLSVSNKKLFQSYKALEHHEGELSHINKLNYMLQTCKELSESYVIIGYVAKELFSGLDGALAIVNRKTNNMAVITEWGNGCYLKSNFKFDDCCALRNGAKFLVKDSKTELRCNHFDKLHNAYICLPLLGQNEITGVLTLCTDNTDTLNNYVIQLAMSFCEVVQLSLANIALRELLYEQSVHDALTGLYNRRYLDVILSVELNRLVSEKKSLCVAMLDLDNLKSINDVHGHTAGDEVLKLIGKTLDSHFRKGDLAFRYGGDEFFIVIEDSNLSDAANRIKKICNEIKSNKIHIDGKLLPPVTVSVGIAEAPRQGCTVKNILQSADAALYIAKEAGRDRVVCFNN